MKQIHKDIKKLHSLANKIEKLSFEATEITARYHPLNFMIETTPPKLRTFALRLERDLDKSRDSEE